MVVIENFNVVIILNEKGSKVISFVDFVILL